MYSNITGTPGVKASYTAVPRTLFYANRQDARFIPGPVTVDGTKSSNPGNAPYTWLLFAGQMVGKITASGKYATSVIGLTTAAAASGATSLTVGVAAAAEIVRRIGTTGSLTVTAPATAGGSVNVDTVGYTAVNLSTGAITLSAATSHAYVTGAMVGPTDGSQTVVTLVCDTYGNKVVDPTNTVRIDVYDAQLWAGGGMVDEGYIVDYPPDVALQAFVKASIRARVPNAVFRGDLANG